MTEKEKMLRGMLYAPARDETLLAELAACKAQCQQFNQRAYQAEGVESAQMLLRRLLGAAGEGLRIEPPFWCDYGWNISVGRNFYMNHGGVILDAGGVTFGDNVLVGPSVDSTPPATPWTRQSGPRGWSTPIPSVWAAASGSAAASA